MVETDDDAEADNYGEEAGASQHSGRSDPTSQKAPLDPAQL